MNKQIILSLGLLVAAIAVITSWTAHKTPDVSRESIQGPEAPAGAAAGVPRFGYTPDRDATEEFVRSLPKPTIRDAAPGLLASVRDRKPVLLYRALYEAHLAQFGSPWVVKAQGIGDCVSWGWAHGADTHLAVMWKLGDSSEWRPAATEAIYGGSRVEARGRARADWSDGSSGGSAAKWVRDFGILFRQRYDQVDLTEYSSSRAKNWGYWGCGGSDDSGRLDKVAREHPIRHVALVTSFEEAAAAISSGYPVPVCSGQGFRDRRDSDGFSEPSGKWSHCMCFIAVRWEPRAGLLCLNSWGPTWVSGPKWPDDQPEGSFWVDAKTCDRMLSGRDSFAVSGYEGFPLRDLMHGDWVRLPVKEPQRTVAAGEILSLAP